MQVFKNAQVLPTLEYGVRNTIQLIADRYEAENGRKHSVGKLFIYVDSTHEAQRLEAIKAADKPKARIFAASLGVLQSDGTIDFKDPQLQIFLMEVMGNSKNRNAKNVELDNGFITSNDTTAPTQKVVNIFVGAPATAPAPAPAPPPANVPTQVVVIAAAHELAPMVRKRKQKVKLPLPKVEAQSEEDEAETND